MKGRKVQKLNQFQTFPSLQECTVQQPLIQRNFTPSAEHQTNWLSFKMCASKTNWYAYRTNSRAEKKVEERLRLHQVEVYLPLQQTIRQWSDRRKKVKIPLIPGLIFVRLEPHRLNDFLELPGISHVVKYLKQPALIRDYEIQNLKILLREAVEIEPTTLQEWQLGDPIEVTEGIFKGLRGKILHKKGQHYIIVKIESIGYHFQINIPSSSAQKTT